jgi:phosphohistidine swiveling domain-containing protein
VEWTLAENGFHPAAGPAHHHPAGSADDQRGWYLSLHKSFEQLVALRHKIEGEYIPRMIAAAREMGRIDLAALSAAELAAEIRRRWDLNNYWAQVYWDEFIPFAHGVRLFGQFYNDRLHPDDPYEFIDLLTETDMQSLQRNDRLQELAECVRKHPVDMESLSPELDATPFEKKLKAFLEDYGDLASGVTGGRDAAGNLEPLLGLIREMGRQKGHQKAPQRKKDRAALTAAFLDHFPPGAQDQVAALLDLARSSYQLRDDDNIHLGRIEARFMAARDAARQRLQKGVEEPLLAGVLGEVAPQSGSNVSAAASSTATSSRFRQRQVVGQPAGPGLVRAPARVVMDAGDLMNFKTGEILVCDAVDPNMTFVIPLAAGIVERRGGMLIHGAIIAREYGLPCVTGIPRIGKPSPS